MARAVLDTNVCITTLFGKDKQAKRCRRFLVDTYDELRCTVVLHEIMRGSRLVRQRKGRKRPSRWQIYQEIEVERLENPSVADWKNAGYAIQEINRTLTTEAVRKMTNDALIAAICVRTNSTLISADTDFATLRQTRALSELRLIPWELLEQKILS